MLDISVQTQNVILDDNPLQGFQLLKEKGFAAVDFSLNGYLKNALRQNMLLQLFWSRSKGKADLFRHRLNG